jgi:hypothetical protein
MTPSRLVTMQRRMGARCCELLVKVGRAIAVLLLATAMPMPALAEDDLPGRVARIAEFAGHLYLSPEDRASEWAEVGLNYPVTSGDNLWVTPDGRAEVDYGGGQFRMTGDTNLHVSRLDDSRIALFVAQGRVIVRVRVLGPGDAARVDTPNTQVQLTRTGLYRIDVPSDRQATVVTVREGEALVTLVNGAMQALPGYAVTVSGPDPMMADVRNSIGQDGFDTWSANRDRYYEQSASAAYVSPQMVGYADLEPYGSWQQDPDYGVVWFPNAVGPEWAPYSDGYWTNVGGWGYTWVDFAPWGYAPFHYGRWARVGGRWGWCPGHYVTRPYWAPALVAWRGGPGWGLSASTGSPVYGWLPLGWRDPYLPSWRRCSNRCWTQFNLPYGVNVRERPRVPPAHYANSAVPGAITAVGAAGLIGARPVAADRVRVSTELAASAPVLASPPSVAVGLSRPPAATPGAGAPPVVHRAQAPTAASVQSNGATPYPVLPSIAATNPAPADNPHGVGANVPHATGIPEAGAAGLRFDPNAQRHAAQFAPPAAPVVAPPSATPGNGGRVVEAPPARTEVKAAPQRSPGIPAPATNVPQSIHGAGDGGAATATRSVPPLRAEGLTPMAPVAPMHALALPAAVAAPAPAPYAIPQGAAQRGVAPPPATGHQAAGPSGPHDAPQGTGQAPSSVPSGTVGGALNR